jgi:hypothetical protein
MLENLELVRSEPRIAARDSGEGASVVQTLFEHAAEHADLGSREARQPRCRAKSDAHAAVCSAIVMASFSLRLPITAT